MALDWSFYRSTKVRQAVPMFDLIHSVDSRKLLDEIEKVATKHERYKKYCCKLTWLEKPPKRV